MNGIGLILFLMVPLAIQDQPLTPAWSLDHQVLATTKVPQAFATPEGGNYSLLLNGKLVYPKKSRHSWFLGYNDWHTFLSELAWSPDGQRIAFVEKTYDWEYSDPYNRDLEGRSSNKHFYLAIVSRDETAARYLLNEIPQNIQLRWLDPN